MVKNPFQLIDETLTGISKAITDPNRDPNYKEAQERRKCEQRGGIWNSNTKTCMLPKAKGPTSTSTDPIKTPSEIEKERWNTLTKEQKVQEVKNLRKTGGQPGAAEALQIKDQEALRQQAMAQRIAQLRQMGVSEAELAVIQEAPIDWGQALSAGVANVIPSVAGGAIGGALVGGVAGAGVGSTITAPAGAILGGIGGFITGLFNGVRANIKSQQKGEINSAVDVLTAAKSNLRQLRMIAQSDPTKAEYALEEYYKQLSLVRQAQRKVQLETQGNLNKFMEDGTDILSDFDLFLMSGGYADLQRIRLEEAALSGQPATPEQIIQFYQEELASDEQ